MTAVSKKAGKSKAGGGNVIAVNRKAGFDYFIEERLEAGLALEGWEVKSMREKRVNLTESYVLVRRGEAWLVGCNITPLSTASTHIRPDPTRTRKLLLHRREISRLAGSVDRAGYTVVPLQLYWKRGKAKLEIGLAKGKQKQDKRADKKEKDWQRQRERLLKHKV
ncbi:SsrA-binding protein SmpB [Halorhodospira halochloris]|uniref:SsrA-binding protein SmpB n=1 Tax=Halorhodospira halochloris TaxID=1052 RepID=UPI000BBA64AC|nr:SsrA-binding protein SmpB [Halorhodospira halochloris]MBK1651159.1 SsrA-binding protein [Halorhodospira halochloris]MCG5547697.1 SsrA-binding protein SmpB [Halorhodospira halochloris]